MTRSWSNGFTANQLCGSGFVRYNLKRAVKEIIFILNVFFFQAFISDGDSEPGSKHWFEKNPCKSHLEYFQRLSDVTTAPSMSRIELERVWVGLCLPIRRVELTDDSALL